MILSFRRMLTTCLLGSVVIVVGCDVPERKPVPTLGGASEPTSGSGTQKAASPQHTPKVTSEPFGKDDKGNEIVLYRLQNGQGLKVSVLNLGAIITSVEVPDRNGKFANVTLSFPDVESYLVNAPYFGGICGRYANRIAKGKFSLDGTDYELEINNSPNHLHGGKTGLIRRIWKSEGFQNDEAVGVNLWYDSPDGEEGYPGKMKFGVAYSLNDKNELRIEYHVTTDKPTVVNVTNHAYWNLAGVPGDSILDHELTLFCSKYLPVDETSIPTGELADVAGTPMDFLKPEKIGARIDQPVNGGGGYDHCYVVDGKVGQLRPAAKIVEPKSGRVMEISTTEPGIQFYTGNFLDGSPATGNAGKHGAFCLETQHFPDSPNRPEFPTTRLNPGEAYTQTTVHKFSVAK